MQKDDSSEDKDLLGRSQANSMDQIKKFLDANPSASIDYTINAFPVETSDKIQIKLDLWDDEKSVYTVIAFYWPVIF